MENVTDVRSVLVPFLSGSAYSDKVRGVALFGSVARGTATAKSDVDLIIDYDASNYDIMHWCGLCEQIENLFRSEYGKNVNLVSAEILQYPGEELFRENVERDMVWVYGGQ